MNASFQSYTDILASHHQDSSSPENFPVLIGYRSSTYTKDLTETTSNITSSQLFMDDSSNDFTNHQLIHPNTLTKVCGGCGDDPASSNPCRMPFFSGELSPKAEIFLKNF
ncbi:uncharacterized protein Dwil_GK23121 [Drosophila willistoni]|uniref:Uncharacterized protein n=1 Tax=Drosophila willistoni TaxID=7260 RepID=B4NMD1_DROWI|nr:uncharacterized protein LOC6652115 isoform X3 [Drosophila willistoni]EDW85520.2 uncharacterized protein Dwil_GK23121 [Drosophila willistoni]